MPCFSTPLFQPVQVHLKEDKEVGEEEEGELEKEEKEDVMMHISRKRW